MIFNHLMLPLTETIIPVSSTVTALSGIIGNVVTNMAHFQSGVNRATKSGITLEIIEKPSLVIGLLFVIIVFRISYALQLVFHVVFYGAL